MEKNIASSILKKFKSIDISKLHKSDDFGKTVSVLNEDNITVMNIFFRL